MMGGQDPSILRVWGGLIRIDLDLDILKLLYVMGNNEFGQLAENNRTNLSSPRYVTAGWHKVAAARDSEGAINPDADVALAQLFSFILLVLNRTS